MKLTKFHCTTLYDCSVVTLITATAVRPHLATCSSADHAQLSLSQSLSRSMQREQSMASTAQDGRPTGYGFGKLLLSLQKRN